MPLSYLILSYHRPDPPAIGPTRDPPARRAATTLDHWQPTTALEAGQFRAFGASRDPNGSSGAIIDLLGFRRDLVALLTGDVLY